MASVTSKSMFSIITTTLVVVGTCPSSSLKALVSDILYASPSGLLTGLGYSSKRQAADVTALPNNFFSMCNCSVAKRKCYTDIIILKMVNLLLFACPLSPQMIALI